jgi:hypothetical protein
MHGKPFWFLWPDFTDVCIGSESLQGLEVLGEVIGQQEGVTLRFSGVEASGTSLS